MLDRSDIPFADIRQNMRELNTINTWLGGHRITINGLAELISRGKHEQPLHICEIGCGGGDNLRALQKWCSHKNIPVRFTGIDIKRECIEFAREQYPQLNAAWICSDYATVNFERDKPDVVFSSLFCHHFTTQELILMLHWMRQNSSTGFFINDLQRHPLAYYAIKLITHFFSSSYLVKNDAPLSVARSFIKKDWHTIFEQAGITHYEITWKWAFRYLVTWKHGGE